MKKKLTFLGIETSCDETAASIVQENSNGSAKILSSVVSSQIQEHKKFGGVVPELAARAHAENIDYIIELALKKSIKSLSDIDGIAVTSGPGLMVCLNVGVNIAKSISAFTNKPLVAVNHLEGHALSPNLTNNIEFPYLLLLISGGHSQFLIVYDVNRYLQLGTTIDDALGEAFDKTSKMLGFSYPGGPEIEKLAKKGDEDFFRLPLPIINKGGCNLSFAGLKTAVLREIKNIKSNQEKYNLAASFQKTINKILRKKTAFAVNQFKDKTKNDCGTIVVAGGVAANKSIRENLEGLAKEKKFRILFPKIEYCGDNAAMIAWAGLLRYKKKLISNLSLQAKSRWPLDVSAPYMKGPGLKL